MEELKIGSDYGTQKRNRRIVLAKPGKVDKCSIICIGTFAKGNERPPILQEESNVCGIGY